MARRVLVGVVVLALAPVVGLAAPAAHAKAYAEAQCASSAADPSAATRLSEACGISVENASARTEYSSAYANPDGTSRVEVSAYPQRVRRSDGTWSSLDPTLVANADGSFSPRASTVDLRLSGGGTGALLTGTRNGQQIALSWAGTLGRPVVSGTTATYPDVLPGVDLVVSARDTGFGEVFVVKNAAAAASPALRRLAFGSSLSGLRWQSGGGGIAALDGAGQPVLASSAPLMWDSSPASADVQAGSGGRAKGDVTGPVDGSRTAPIQLGVEGSTITLAPDAGMLGDSSVTFPLYLDPTITYSAWTMINSQYTSQSYWSYDKTDCPSGYSTECAKVGQIYQGTMDYRSIFQFPTSAFHGKQVLGAKFTIDLLWSAYSANSTTELRQTNGINSGTTWSNNAGSWGGVLASVSNANHGSSRKLTEISGSSLTSTLQSIANGGAGTITLGLKASTESSDSGWKKFDAKTARLVVTTNTVPNTPDTLTVDGKGCVAGANRPVIATATPVLKSRVTDADGDSLDDWIAYAKWNGSSFVDVASGHQTPVPNGGYGQITTGTLVDGGIYTFRSQSNDSPSHSGTAYGTSPVTNSPGNCEFEVDLTDPDTPTVTGDVYPENCNACGSVGKTGRFAFASSADVVSFRWGFTSPPTAVANPAAIGGTVSVDWTPAAGGAQTLYVQAIDRAGRTRTKTYQFTVASPSTPLARWKLSDPAGATTLADDTGNGNTVTLGGGATPGVPGRIVPGLDGVSRTAVSFDGTSGAAVTAGPVLAHTSRSFSVSAWVELADSTVTGTVVSQGGNDNSAFMLEYEKSGVWKLTTPAADSGTTTYPGAQSTSPVRLNTWTHLVGVYDSAAKTVKLYVNGVLEGTATGVTTWDANGPLHIGGTVPWKGTIGEVQVWDRVLSAGEVFDLSDPLAVGRVGEWHFDEVGPGPAYDASGLAHDLTFANGASIPATGAGQTGTGLLLNGTDQYAAPDGPVLNTDQSFTVSVWARLADKSTSHNLVTQPGAHYSPFYLQYNVSYDRWVLNASNQDGDPVVWSNSPRSTSVPAVNTWTHLVAVYDAARQELRLYVNGVLEGTATGVVLWNSTGRLEIGHGWTGAIDELRVYQGAVADVTRIP